MTTAPAPAPEPSSTMSTTGSTPASSASSDCSAADATIVRIHRTPGVWDPCPPVEAGQHGAGCNRRHRYAAVCSCGWTGHTGRRAATLDFLEEHLGRTKPDVVDVAGEPTHPTAPAVPTPSTSSAGDPDREALLQEGQDAAGELATRIAEDAALALADGVGGLSEHDELRRLVAGWLLEYPSPSTRRAYAGDLTRLAGFLAERSNGSVQLLAAGRSHLSAWAEAMRREQLAETTIARRLSTASSFYEFAVDEDAIARNPAARVRRPKRSAESAGASWLNVADSKTLLAEARADSPRAHAIVATMLTTGARVSELLAADVANLGHNGGHRTLTVVRKGGLRQELVLAPWVAHTIDVYLEHRGGPAGGSGDTAGSAGPLFATKARASRGGGHGRLDEPAVWRLIRRLATAAGLPQAGRLGPHGLRHSFATQALDAGAPLRDVQDAMGHADPRTTRRYDRLRAKLDRSPAYAVAAALAE